VTTAEVGLLDDSRYWALVKTVRRQHPAHDVEIRNGEYVVVAPHDYLPAALVMEIGARILDWARPQQRGRVFDSNGGIVFPDGDLIAPDVAYVSRERLPAVPAAFARVIPELVFEIRSAQQRESACRAKVALLIGKGIDVVVYVDPSRRLVEIHRPGSAPVVLGDGDRFTVPDVLPGFGFAVAELWPQ
jgi:Uma2 family endonuclease